MLLFIKALGVGVSELKATYGIHSLTIIVNVDAKATIDNTQDADTVIPCVQKVVRDGQVVILRDGKAYSILGALL